MDLFFSETRRKRCCADIVLRQRIATTTIVDSATLLLLVGSDQESSFFVSTGIEGPTVTESDEVRRWQPCCTFCARIISYDNAP